MAKNISCEVSNKLAVIWGNLLNVPNESIKPTSNFFEMGGSSLRLLILHVEIHRTFHVTIEVPELLRNSTFLSLASIIEQLILTTNLGKDL